MTRTDNSTTCVALDIGSNSTAVAVARCSPDSLKVLESDSTMLRIGEDVKAHKRITQEIQQSLIATLQQYQVLGEKHQAQVFLALATEAMREAENSPAVVEAIERETGLTVKVVSGVLEAALTYYGATYEPSLPPDAGVLDVGGGSTEIITARQRRISWLTSLPIGSGWLHDQFLTADPPLQDEIVEAQDFLHTYLIR